MRLSSTRSSNATQFSDAKASLSVATGGRDFFFIGLIGELGVRLVADDGMQFDLEMWKYARDVKVPSNDSLVGHEHGANRRAKLMGVDFVTNSHGLRDREFSFDHTTDILRIEMLGDSLTVGCGSAFRVHVPETTRATLRQRGD